MPTRWNLLWRGFRKMSTPWGEARREVGIFYGEISARLHKGQTIKSIFGDLKAAGQVSVTYENFRRHVNRHHQSSNTRFPSSWGLARKEVIGLRSQIMSALAEGRSLKSIYDELKAEGRVSSSYRGGFQKNVKNLRRQSPHAGSAFRHSLVRRPRPVPETAAGIHIRCAVRRPASSPASQA